MKRAFFVVFGIILLALGSYAVWFFAVAPKTERAAVVENPPDTPPISVSPIVPPENQQPLPPLQNNGSATRAVSGARVVGFWIAKNSDIFVVTESGAILKNGESFSSGAPSGISSISGSPDGSRALIASGYPFAPSFTVFDIAAKKLIKLPYGIKAAAWGPSSSDELMILGTETGAALSRYSIGSGTFTRIATVPATDPTLSWITPTEVAIHERFSSLVPATAYTYTITSRVATITALDESGLSLLWSGDGSRALKLSGSALTAIDQKGGAIAAFPFLAWPPDCAWDGAVLYCPSRAASADRYYMDDYLKGKRPGRTRLFRIDFSAPEIPLITEIKTPALPESLDARMVKVLDKKLYFVDAPTGILYEVSL